jgi:nitroreductase
MDIKEAIRTKRAVRQFTDKPLPQEAVEAILNAGRRAQSSKNTQPWRFVALQDRGLLEALGTLGPQRGHLADAALGVLILTPEPEAKLSIMFDAGQAAAYMQLAGWEHGVGSCIAGIRDPEQARKLLGFPDDWHARIGISFGYPQEPGALTAAPEKGGRLPFDEVVHFNRWED